MRIALGSTERHEETKVPRIQQTYEPQNRESIGWSVRQACRGSSLLASAAFVALIGASPAAALTFTNIFENSWTADNPNSAAATNAITAVESEYSTDFANPVNVTIQFGFGDFNGSPIPANALGVTGFPTTSFPPPFGPASNETSLPTVESLLTTHSAANPQNTALATAVTHLPASYPNPGGATYFFVPDAQYLALTGSPPPDGDTIDAFIGFATLAGTGNGYDYTGGTPSASNFDFQSVAEHEIAHAMARVEAAFLSGVAGGAPPFLTSLDFYRYTCGTGTLNPDFVKSCFSIDGGATDLQMFDNISDSSDWACSPPAIGNDPYNACADPGVKYTVSSVDITEMNALGWDPPKAVTATPEPGTLVLLGSAVLGFAALRRRRPT